MTCEVLEDEKRILSIDVTRPGAAKPLAFPLRTYSALGDELLFTECAVDAVGSTTHLGAKARLTIEDHPRVRDLDREAIERARPLEVRWFSDYRTMLDRPSIRYRMSA
jgi:hypothetical protein